MTYEPKWTEEPEDIEIEALVLDDQLFPRERIDRMKVDEYAEMMREEGAQFPPVLVIRLKDGRLMVVDGWHRINAAKRLDLKTLPTRIRSGEWFYAIEAATASNAFHGLPRTNADKRKAVEMLLTMPKWADASNRAIARHCGLSHPFVANMRRPAPIVETVTTPEPEPEPEPFDDEPYDLPQIGAPAERAQQEERTDEPWGGPYSRPYDPGPVTPLVKTINDVDILAWLMGALDPKRRWLADIAFASIESADERLKHDATVQKWLLQHERRDAAE
jgi:ParB-like chromosome segregation protein Spo0J